MEPISTGILAAATIFNTGVGLWAAAKQAKATEAQNKIIGEQYREEMGEQKRHTAWGENMTEKQFAEQKHQTDIGNRQQNFSEIAQIINNDQALKNQFVGMWSSLQTRRA